MSQLPLASTQMNSSLIGLMLSRRITRVWIAYLHLHCVSLNLTTPFLRPNAAFPLLQKANRAGVALRGGARDEVAPGAGMPGLLNRLPSELCEERRVETRPTRGGLDFDTYLTRRSGMA